MPVTFNSLSTKRKNAASMKRVAWSPQDTDTLLDCHLTAKRDLELLKHTTSLYFLDTNKEKEDIIFREMDRNGLTHIPRKQAVAKYECLLKTFRYKMYEDEHHWWDKMARLQEGSERIKPEYEGEDVAKIVTKKQKTWAREDVDTLLDCHLTAKKELDLLKKCTILYFMDAKKEKDKIIFREMAKNRMKYPRNQAVFKYEDLLKQFRAGLRGGRLQINKEQYFWWDKMVSLHEGNERLFLEYDSADKDMADLPNTTMDTSLDEEELLHHDFPDSDATTRATTGATTRVSWSPEISVEATSSERHDCATDSENDPDLVGPASKRRRAVNTMGPQSKRRAPPRAANTPRGKKILEKQDAGSLENAELTGRRRAPPRAANTPRGMKILEKQDAGSLENSELTSKRRAPPRAASSSQGMKIPEKLDTKRSGAANTPRAIENRDAKTVEHARARPRAVSTPRGKKVPAKKDAVNEETVERSVARPLAVSIPRGKKVPEKKHAVNEETVERSRARPRAVSKSSTRANEETVARPRSVSTNRAKKITESKDFKAATRPSKRRASQGTTSDPRNEKKEPEYQNSDLAKQQFIELELERQKFEMSMELRKAEERLEREKQEVERERRQEEYARQREKEKHEWEARQEELADRRKRESDEFFARLAVTITTAMAGIVRNERA